MFTVHLWEGYILVFISSEEGMLTYSNIRGK